MAEEKGRKIPVFTVVKNGAILKNIFVIEKPRVMEDEEDPHNQESETEEILIVGRHPDCNIMLTHPSISRFHLQIHSRPSSQKLSVIDLSSVHGTWVWGKKIDSGVAVELNEGDTIKLGGSTRVYKLHWIPMSRAYDMENPFVSSMDMGVEEEKEEENAVESHLGVNTLSTERGCGEEKDSLMVEEETSEMRSSVPAAEKEVFSMDWMLEGLVSLFCDGSSGLVMNTEIPPAPPLPENMNPSTYDTEISLEKRELSFLKELELETYSATMSVTVEENQQKMDVSRVSTQPHLMESNKSTLQAEDIVLKILESQQVHEEDQIPQPLSALKPREESENAAADGCKHYLSGKTEDAEEEKLSSKDYGSQHTGQVHEEDQIPRPLSALKPREESENAAADGCKHYLSGKIEDAEDEKLSSKDYGSQHTGLNILESLQVHEEDQIPQPLSALKPREESENAAADGCKHYLSGKTEDADDAKLSSKDYGIQHTGLNILESQQVHEEDQIPQPLSALKPREESENAAADGCKHYLSGKIEDADDAKLSCKDYGSQHTGLNILESPQVHEEDQIPQPLSALKPREESENAAADGCKHYLSGKIEDADDAKLSSKDYGIQHTGLNILESQQVHEEDQIPQPLSALKPREESENAAADGCKHYLSGKIEDADDAKLSCKDYGSQHTGLNILESPQVHEEDQIPQPLSALKPREESENAAADGCKHYLSGKIEDADDAKLSSKDYGIQHTGLNILESQQVHEEDQIPQPLSALKPRDESENAAADGCKHYLSGKIEDADDAKLSSKDYGIQHTSFYSVSLPTESVNSSLPIAEDDKRNPTPHSLLAPAVLSESENLDGSPLRLETKSNFQSIWSRRGKPDSVLQIQTGKSGADENKAVPKSLFVSSEDEEMFTPDKENFTPTTILMKALKRKGKLEETKHSSSNVTFSSHLQREDDMITSDKENQTPKLIKEHKSTRKASRNQPKLEQGMVIKGKAVRVPIQFLSVDSACETVSEALVPNTSVRSCKSTTLNTKKMEKRIGYPSLNKSVGEQRRTWTMVADTSSLMDKESRKLLKLLQGLKGTLLVIPRMVIRELDCLKRRGTLFRRKNEASSVLEWIEECLVKTKWWIHVQSTMEEGWPIAPTPPATPYSHFSQDSVFGPFSARESLMEIATPTAQDHILDYALLCRKMRSGDGQLVLLSNDVTLKIKAMAEGLICETVQEFRESLVNPFSKRFMWADSSPRGHTWSVMDDVVLRDKYNRCPLKKPSKGDIKGLKLILLHNSHYGQISSIR